MVHDANGVELRLRKYSETAFELTVTDLPTSSGACSRESAGR